MLLSFTRYSTHIITNADVNVTTIGDLAFIVCFHLFLLRSYFDDCHCNSSNYCSLLVAIITITIVVGDCDDDFTTIIATTYLDINYDCMLVKSASTSYLP